VRLVAVTQRVGIERSYGERRDMLDQNWAHFLADCGYTILPVPNNPKVAIDLVGASRPVGLIFSGGNDLVACGGDAPERDDTERLLLQHALASGMPLLGVCRGLQFLLHAFGAKLERLSGHVATRHTVTGEAGHFETNSYHNWGASAVERPLVVDARADDGTIEAIHHESARVAGIMWHPERESGFAARDIAYFRSFLGTDQ